MSAVVKISWPATHQFWEIPVLFADAHLLVIDKPAGLLLTPDRYQPDRPSLMRLLHDAIAAGKPWARELGLDYLSQAHRLDDQTSGLLLLARSHAVLVKLADWFGTDQPTLRHVALVEGTPATDSFAVNAKLAPHPTQPGLMRVDPQQGKRAQTRFTVQEKFSRHTLLTCEPLTQRPHQIRAHLHNTGLRLVGDELYGGKPLWLSRLKPGYRLKPGRTERPLLARTALHTAEMTLPHPVTGESLTVAAPWPKDLRVAVKYLREYAPAGGRGPVT